MLISRRSGILAALAMLVLLAASACTSTVPGSATPVAPQESGGEDSGGEDSGGESGGDPGESDPDSESPSSEDPDAPDEGELDSAIIELYGNFGLAWLGGPESAMAYQVAHNHPLFTYTEQECLAGLAGQEPNYIESYEADLTSVEPDPGWEIPDGRFAGEVPEGYLLTVDLTVSFGNGVPDAGEEESTVHLAYLDDELFFFFPCEATG